MIERDEVTEKLKRLIELESDAINKYLDCNYISRNDYINDEIMEEKDYEEYNELFKEIYGYCFECSLKECDKDDCIYQEYLKGKQTNES